MRLNRAAIIEHDQNQLFLEAVLATFQGEKSGALYSFMYGEPVSESDPVRSDEIWHDMLEQTSDYHVIREEASAIRQARNVLLQVIPPGLVSVEFAPGDAVATSLKSRPFNEAVRPSRYIALDINGVYAGNAARYIGNELNIPNKGIETDIMDGDPIQIGEPAVYSLFGGLLANLPAIKGVDHLEMLTIYLAKLRAMMQKGDYFVITQDACQNPAKLYASYNDPLLGLCAMSILHRIKRDLPTKGFDPDKFEYEGIFFPETENEALCVRSKTVQAFQIAGQSIVLKTGQIIPLINSYKFNPMDFATAVSRAGFSPATDSVRYKDANLHILRAA